MAPPSILFIRFMLHLLVLLFLGEIENLLNYLLIRTRWVFWLGWVGLGCAKPMLYLFAAQV